MEGLVADKDANDLFNSKGRNLSLVVAVSREGVIAHDVTTWCQQYKQVLKKNLNQGHS